MQADENSPQRNQLEPVIANIEAVNVDTVVINLNKPFPPLLALLTDRAGLMVSPTAVKKYGKDFGSNPVGTGPFVFKEWIRGNQIVLDRNPNFWQNGQPYLDRVTFNDIPAAVVGIQRLTTGELDFVPELTPQDTGLIENNPQLKLVQVPVGEWFALQWQVDKPPFNNLKLRQAIAHAIDRKRLNAIVWSGRGTVATSETPPGLWWSPPETDSYPYDPALAKQILADSGVAPGTELTLSAPSDNTLRSLVTLVKENLEAIGLHVRLEPIGQSDWYARVIARKINFTPMRWTQRADPDGLIQFLYDSKGAANSTGYNNPEVDKLIAEAQTMADPVERKPIYDRIHQIVANDLPYVSVAFGGAYEAMNKKVGGYVNMPDLIPRYRDMWKLP
jgi:peptide/nickel transport system substrate-binding protein